eukprot:Colp12_sorted_trinity150504_noHs@16816
MASKVKKPTSGNLRKEKGEASSNIFVRFDKALTRALYLGSNPIVRLICLFLEYSGHGVPWLIGIVSSFIYTRKSGEMQLLANLFVANIFDLLVIVVLKTLFKRARPAHNSGDMLATVSVDNYSFPSGHTTRSVMIATGFYVLFADQYGLEYTYSILGWAVAVAISRVLLGRHHVFDVLAGVVVGVCEFFVVHKYFWVSPYQATQAHHTLLSGTSTLHIGVDFIVQNLEKLKILVLGA